LLPRLQQLKIIGCSDLLSDSFLAAPKSVKFPRMKQLCLRAPPSFQMLHRCAALENLTFDFHTQSDIDHILNLLCSTDFSFAETLQTLDIHGGRGCKMTCHHLETLFIEVTPRFANLEKLVMSDALNILDLKVVANRLRTDKSCNISKSLREVIFN
jgi:hypothetical protein